MGSKYVQIETEGAIARVTITRPEKLNALNREIFVAEIVRTLVGSLGLMLTVPLTSLIASGMAKRTPQSP